MFSYKNLAIIPPFQSRVALVTSGKKKLANDFSLKRTCHWHLLGAISSRLAVNWQVRQLII
jgi:hypothetical protein